MKVSLKSFKRLLPASWRKWPAPHLTPTAGGDEAALTLKSLLAPFDRKASVICTIPANAATAKNIEVPSIDPEEIKSIINLQASHHTPYSKEEVLISLH